MSKSASKERFLQAGVPTPGYALVHSSDQGRTYGERAAALGFPVVVKPDSQGSSLGVGIADSPRRLGERLAESFALDPFAIVERLIVGREFTVAVLDRRPLPLLEIVAATPIFSFDAKYTSAQTEHRFETGLPASAEAGCAGRCRGSRGTGNQRPRPSRSHARRRGAAVGAGGEHRSRTHGRSLAPQAAARAGITMSALCTWMIHDCLTRETVA